MRNIFRRLLTFTLFFFTVSFAAAQPPAQGQGRSPMAGTTAAMTSHVFGRIIDAAGKPVADASVMLLRSAMDTTSGKTKSRIAIPLMQPIIFQAEKIQSLLTAGCNRFWLADRTRISLFKPTM